MVVSSLEIVDARTPSGESERFPDRARWQRLFEFESGEINNGNASAPRLDCDDGRGARPGDRRGV